MIEVTDCPHPAGTKEHHAWIVEVYIPSLDDDRREQDRLRAGAEAIGGKLVDGQLWRNPLVNGAPVKAMEFVDATTFEPMPQKFTVHWHNPQEDA